MTDDPIDPRGFWGYQHVIEHIPRDGDIVPVDLDQPNGQPLQLGVNIDPLIDTALDVECLQPVLDQFDIYQEGSLRPCGASARKSCPRAMRDGVTDHVLYFCCHAEQEGDSAVIVGRPGRLRLGDQDEAGWITPSDITLWIDDGSLASRPVVYLNACASGQFNSVPGVLQQASTAPVPKPATTRRPGSILCRPRRRGPQTLADPGPRRTHQRVPIRRLSCSDDFSSPTGWADRVVHGCGYCGPLQPGKSAYSMFGPYNATLTASSSSSRLTGVATPSGRVRVQVPVQVTVYTSCR